MTATCFARVPYTWRIESSALRGRSKLDEDRLLGGHGGAPLKGIPLSELNSEMLIRMLPGSLSFFLREVLNWRTAMLNKITLQTG